MHLETAYIRKIIILEDSNIVKLNRWNLMQRMGYADRFLICYQVIS